MDFLGMVFIVILFYLGYNFYFMNPDMGFILGVVLQVVAFLAEFHRLFPGGCLRVEAELVAEDMKGLFVGIVFLPFALSVDDYALGKYLACGIVRLKDVAAEFLGKEPDGEVGVLVPDYVLEVFAPAPGGAGVEVKVFAFHPEVRPVAAAVDGEPVDTKAADEVAEPGSVLEAFHFVVQGADIFLWSANDVPCCAPVKHELDVFESALLAGS